MYVAMERDVGLAQKIMEGYVERRDKQGADTKEALGKYMKATEVLHDAIHSKGGEGGLRKLGGRSVLDAARHKSAAVSDDELAP